MVTPSRRCLGDSVETFPVLRHEVTTGEGDATVNHADRSGAGTGVQVGRGFRSRAGVLARS